MALHPLPRVETNEMARWAHFEGLCELAEGGVRGLSAEQLRELAALYRRVALDLAAHRRRGTLGPTIPYLNHLVARGRRVIYRREPARWNPLALWRLLAQDFPRQLRRELGLLGLASLLTFGPCVLGYLAMARDPAWMMSLFPDLYLMVESYGDQSEPGALAAAIEEGSYASASAFIMFNNIRVTIMAYGLGLLFGIGTLYILLFNGAMLGSVAYFYLSRGPEFREYFYAGILPHGVLELTAIAISGAAGLMLGRALLFPGDLRRTDSLRQAAPQTLPLIGGVVAMLVVAGLIEGFITPSPALSPVQKMAVGIGSGVLFWTYIGLAGRKWVRRPRLGRRLQPSSENR